MIEALASIMLLAVGIVAAMSALGGMTKADGGMRESERMQRLADEKLQELLATGDWEFSTEGDFQDRNDSRYNWTATLEPSGIENLQVLAVTVSHANVRDDVGTQAYELIYVPPTTGAGGQG